MSARFIVSLVALSSVALCSGCHSVQKNTAQPSSHPQVTIAGAVSHPGTMEVKPGLDTLGDVIVAASPESQSEVIVPNAQPGVGFALSIAQELAADSETLADFGKRILATAPGTTIPPASVQEKTIQGDFRRVFNSLTENHDRLRTKRKDLNAAVNAIVRSLGDGKGQGEWVELTEAVRLFGQSVSEENLLTLTQRSKEFGEKVARIIELLQAQAGVQNVQVGVETKEEALIIQLRRPEAAGMASYFFPLSYVQNGPAGAIPLQSGDIIYVKWLRQTDLRDAAPVADGVVRLTGFVQKAGNYARSRLPNLAVVQRSIDTRVRASQSTTVVRRTSASGESEIYILPNRFVADADSYGLVPTHSGDSIQIVPSDWAPLVGKVVFNSQFAARSVGQIEGRSPMLNHHQRKMVHLADHKERARQAVHDLISRH